MLLSGSESPVKEGRGEVGRRMIRLTVLLAGSIVGIPPIGKQDFVHNTGRFGGQVMGPLNERIELDEGES